MMCVTEGLRSAVCGAFVPQIQCVDAQEKELMEFSFRKDSDKKGGKNRN